MWAITMSFYDSCPGYSHSSGHQHHPDLDSSSNSLSPPQGCRLTFLPDSSAGALPSSEPTVDKLNPPLGSNQGPQPTVPSVTAGYDCPSPKHPHSVHLNHTCRRTQLHHTCPWRSPLPGMPCRTLVTRKLLPCLHLSAWMAPSSGVIPAPRGVGKTRPSASKAHPSIRAAPALQ